MKELTIGEMELFLVVLICSVLLTALPALLLIVETI